MSKHDSKVILRKWNESDFQTVRNILLVTWKDAYHFIPEKDIITHLEKFYSIPKLFELYSNRDVVGIIAEKSNAAVGWMKLFDDRSADKFYVSSLYVLPQYQGFGLGKILLSKAEEEAKSFSHDKIWLGVMKDNIKALEWYKKIGFIFVEEEPFKMGETEVLHLIGYKIISTT